MRTTYVTYARAAMVSIQGQQPYGSYARAAVNPLYTQPDGTLFFLIFSYL